MSSCSTSIVACPRCGSPICFWRWTAATGFTDAFTHLRTGVPCQDRIGLLKVLVYPLES